MRTQPVATLPNGATVRFEVHKQNVAGELPIRFDWNPSTDPLSFVDIALDQLAFALDYNKFPYEMADKSRHDYVQSVGGITWNLNIGRDLAEPRTRIHQMFGDDVEIIASSYGALRQGLRMWSLHLSEAALYIISEGNSDYRHKVRLANLVSWRVTESGEWSIIECVDDNQVHVIPQEERMIAEGSTGGNSADPVPLRSIGFFKLCANPGWTEFTEMIVLAQSGCVPSLIETFNEPGFPSYNAVFLSTRKGKMTLPKSGSDFELAQSLKKRVPEFSTWEDSHLAKLPEWRALK